MLQRPIIRICDPKWLFCILLCFLTLFGVALLSLSVYQNRQVSRLVFFSQPGTPISTIQSYIGKPVSIIPVSKLREGIFQSSRINAAAATAYEYPVVGAMYFYVLVDSSGICVQTLSWAT